MNQVKLFNHTVMALMQKRLRSVGGFPSFRSVFKPPGPILKSFLVVFMSFRLVFKPPGHIFESVFLWRRLCRQRPLCICLRSDPGPEIVGFLKSKRRSPSPKSAGEHSCIVLVSPPPGVHGMVRIAGFPSDIDGFWTGI